MRSAHSSCLFALAAVLCALGLPAESRAATLAGTVFDQAGKAVPNATVAVKNDSTGNLRTLTTDQDGRFSATGLSAGSYSVEASASGFATSHRAAQQLTENAAEDITIPLSVGNVSQTVTVEAVASVAAELAPSGNTLDATSARTEITGQFIKYFTSPLADFNEVVQMAPGTFSVNSNGVGLGQGKTYFRGFKDGQYTMTFDGIPFQDTNDPTHHSWAFFPGQWIGGTDFDRSPGGASNVGPTNFGGSINLLSQDLLASPQIMATASYGSFNTRLFDLSLDSGQFDPGKKSSLLIDLHQMLSDGYETYNYQKRVAGSTKYQYKLSDKTVFTAFFGLIDVWTNTPDTNQPSRAQVAQFGDNFLLNGDPTSPFFFGYSFYHIQTDFGYIGLNSDLGHGWRLDNKINTYRYWNKQNLEKNLTAISPTSAIDKLNGANHIGDVLALSQDSRWGTFRTGIWYDWAYTDRYQYVSSPFNWADVTTPNFHEHFITQTYQPFAEYQWRATPKLVITAGVKDARYDLHFEQYQDNGKAVGCLGGVLDKTKTCIGGVQFYPHTVQYDSWLPSVAARYRVRSNWSAYAQFGEGSQIPPTSVFDVPAGSVKTPPQQTLAKTYQIGSVLKFNRWTLDVDGYFIHFDNPYSAINDPTSQTELIYVQTGPSNTKGIEAESTIFIRRGLSLYLNGTLGSARYSNTGLWVANAPSYTETAGLTWQEKNWDMGFLSKRIGKMYNDNGSVNQAAPIHPWSVSNLFLNYTVKNSSFLRGSRLGLAVNNLFDNHSITGITPATPATASVPFAPAGGDLLTMLPGRSVMATLTVGFAPRR
jgi:iron complex outermembrane receptor protein